MMKATVEKIKDGKIYCVWFEGYDLHRAIFNSDGISSEHLITKAGDVVQLKDGAIGEVL
jgi:uncharacterized protein YodC (DUF2158 family)